MRMGRRIVAGVAFGRMPAGLRLASGAPGRTLLQSLPSQFLPGSVLWRLRRPSAPVIAGEGPEC